MQTWRFNTTLGNFKSRIYSCGKWKRSFVGFYKSMKIHQNIELWINITSQDCTVCYQSFSIAKFITCTVGINNWCVSQISTFLCLSKVEEWADLFFRCLTSLIWCFGQIILSSIFQKVHRYWSNIARIENVVQCHS